MNVPAFSSRRHGSAHVGQMNESGVINVDRIISNEALPLAHAKRVRNTSRRVKYRSSRALQESFSLPTMPTTSVILVIYSEQPNHFKSSETPVHAIGAELWVGSELKEQM